MEEMIGDAALSATISSACFSTERQKGELCMLLLLVAVRTYPNLLETLLVQLPRYKSGSVCADPCLLLRVWCIEGANSLYWINRYDVSYVVSSSRKSAPQNLRTLEF